MARIETDPNYTSPTFSRATAATDLFKKEDVQNLAAAVSTHDHSTGKGLTIPFATSIPNGTITSAMIADGTIDTADLKDGSVTSAKILDGTIATGDLANAAVTNAKLASDTARANLLTNGGFEIWQRGNGPFTTLGQRCADQWVLNQAGTDTLSVSRDTANADIFSSACAAVTFTLGTGAGTSQLYQGNMSDQAPVLKGRSVTFSVRVRTSTANAVRPAINTGSARAYGSYHSGGGAYETLTVTATIESAATTAQVAVFFAASCTAYVDNAMLVVGSQAADYAPLHPADDLARCLRYYENVGGTSPSVTVSGIATAASQSLREYVAWYRKAVTPTVTKAGSWAVSNCGQPTIPVFDVSGGTMQIVSNAAGDTYAQSSTSGVGLTVEANP